jgi:hypothetical protein
MVALVTVLSIAVSTAAAKSYIDYYRRYGENRYAKTKQSSKKQSSKKQSSKKQSSKIGQQYSNYMQNIKKKYKDEQMMPKNNRSLDVQIINGKIGKQHLNSLNKRPKNNQ